MAGRLDVRGGLERVVEAVSRLSLLPSPIERITSPLSVANDQTRARRNVHHHYDLGNDFYQSWLDDQMVYTCAYFEHPDVSLEDAQRAKLDLVCRKLRLQPGETVVEAGCGWGALALHMARAYGVRVKAFNVSREQIAYARERAAREGLASQVEFIDDDYRNVAGEYDAFVSIGMLEHVGLKHFGSLAEVLTRVLRRARGRGLLHFIGRDIPRPLNAWVVRRIFPGAYPPDAGGSGHQGSRAGADVDRGRREPAAALCADARALGRTVRRDRAAGARALRRDVQARLGAVPGRVRSRVCGGHPAALPDRLLAAGDGAALLGTRGDVRPLDRPIRAATDRHGALRRADRRRRTRGIDLCARPAAAGWRVLVIDRARFPRDKVCAGWVTPGRLPPARSRSRRVPRHGTDHPADHRIPHLGHRRPGDRNPLRRRRSAMRSGGASSTPSS